MLLFFLHRRRAGLAQEKEGGGGEGGDPQCALHADLLRPIMQRRTTTRRLCRLSAGRAAAHGFRPFRDFVNRPPNGREDHGTNRARGKVNRVRSDSRGRVQRSRRRACGRLFSSRGARSRDRIVEISRSLGSRLTRVGLAAASSARGGGEGRGGEGEQAPDACASISLSDAPSMRHAAIRHSIRSRPVRHRRDARCREYPSPSDSNYIARNKVPRCIHRDTFAMSDPGWNVAARVTA
jgi:hypothetical protein